MNKKLRLTLFISIPLIGILAGYLLMGRNIQISVDGEQSEVFTRALTVKGALRSAGYRLSKSDSVNPPAGSWLSRATIIALDRSRTLQIWVDSDGTLLEVTTAARTPGGILLASGITPAAEDIVRINGRTYLMDEEINQNTSFVLQYTPAVPIIVNLNGFQTIRSAQPTLGQALWDAEIRLFGGDSLNLAFGQTLEKALEVEIYQGKPILITVDGLTISSYTSADKVASALVSAGVALQDMDYSIPAENEVIPGNGRIQVVRVREEVLLEQSVIPYQSELIADADMEINQREVVQDGQNGFKASRIRVRYEDGVEISRVNETDIIMSEPVTQIVRYGSKLVIKTMDTPDGPISYYFTANVTATSYSPCRSGVPDKCYSGTSYGLPVQQGVIGVHRAWYYMFRGTQIYVPGYGVGTIADIGYYPYNDNWIDLAYTDADWVEWPAVNLTIYFLTPAPAGFTGVLP